MGSGININDDRKTWERLLLRPDWYVGLMPVWKGLIKYPADLPQASREIISQTKESLYDCVEEALLENKVPLAKTGPNLDKERRSVDTIVIHHSKRDNISLERLNAIHFLRLYMPYLHQEAEAKGRLILAWSNHFYEDRLVFWGYHWLVFADGRAIRLLNDDYIGWHSGSWNINTRSVAICFAADLSLRSPTTAAIKAVAEIIRQDYSHVLAENIIGHSDVIIGRTTCPGSEFSHWRQKILAKLS